MLLFDEEQKKHTLTCKKENSLLLFFYWMPSFILRLFVDEPGREKREKVQVKKERSNIHRIMRIRKRNQPTK